MIEAWDEVSQFLDSMVVKEIVHDAKASDRELCLVISDDNKWESVVGVGGDIEDFLE